jgi:hypothetical protein
MPIILELNKHILKPPLSMVAFDTPPHSMNFYIVGEVYFLKDKNPRLY